MFTSEENDLECSIKENSLTRDLLKIEPCQIHFSICIRTTGEGKQDQCVDEEELDDVNHHSLQRKGASIRDER